jgi:hypothetical protein
MKLQRQPRFSIAIASIGPGAQNQTLRSTSRGPVETTGAAQNAVPLVKNSARKRKAAEPFDEAELLVNGHTKDILMDAAGVIVEVEE